MKIGTKSVLFGAHCFFIHPWFVAYAWYKLYGFPWDPRLWVCFFVHDLGYFGKPNMDGPEGERHVEFGAYWVSKLFDKRKEWFDNWHWCGPGSVDGLKMGKWGKMCLYHSRYYSKKHNAEPSKLCFADKLSLYYTPAWLYLPMVRATGEIEEYLENAKKADSKAWKSIIYNPTTTSYKVFQKAWYRQLQLYMYTWVFEHLDGKKDEWTDEKRNQVNE